MEININLFKSEYANICTATNSKKKYAFFTSIVDSKERLSQVRSELSEIESSLQELVALAANFALIRVERSGTGASEGDGCDTLDYETEVRHYREAFDQLQQHSWVNADQIVVLGSSLGSTVAPLVAKDKKAEAAETPAAEAKAPAKPKTEAKAPAKKAPAKKAPAKAAAKKAPAKKAAKKSTKKAAKKAPAKKAGAKKAAKKAPAKKAKKAAKKRRR